VNDSTPGMELDSWYLFASAASTPHRADRPVRLRRVVIGVSAAAVGVLVAVAVAGTTVSRHTAESQAVHEAAQVGDLLATSVVQPVLTDAMVDDPVAMGMVLDPIVRTRVLSDMVVRVKVWSPQGRILYSDEPRLVGRTFTLDAGLRSVLTAPQTRAEVSDLQRPENQFERSQGKLLEVYRPVWTPGGRPLLFETYLPYSSVTARSGQLWRGFSGIMLSSLLAIFILLLPLVWTLLTRARRAQAQREALMQRALDASTEERRRIAATLHDGPVQEIAAASFAVSAGAEQAAASGEDALAGTLREAAGAVRTSMGGLRSLLIDIFPPSLRSSGLGAALRDLVATLGGRGLEIDLDIDEAAAHRLPPEDQETVFRIVQELLRNAVRHSGAATVTVTLGSTTYGVQVSVIDDGVGFDPLLAGAEGHFGLSLVRDLVIDTGADLRVHTGPGTSWLLTVPSR
jgi:two-component system NarL family sensor kinase